MKKSFGAAMSMLLMAGAISASSNRQLPNVSDYDMSDTLVYDSIGYDSVEILIEEDSIICPSPFAGNTFLAEDSSGARFKCIVNMDGTVTITEGHANGVKTLRIPESVEAIDTQFQVTEIAKFAFAALLWVEDSPMKGVRHLVIPEGIVSVGQNAFDHSPDLETAELPSSLETISYCMFNDCFKLRKVDIQEDSRLRSIESFAFAGCGSLEAFNIPREVSSIGEGPWRGCSSLERITLQEGNYDFVVDEGVLYKGWQGDLLQYPAGKKDKSYQILYGTKAICNSAFYGNPYIESISIPASVDSISHIAFFDCKSLKDVKLSDVIPFIGNSAFGECPSLKEITLYGNPAYTNEPEDPYNTFSEATKVTILKNAPVIRLPKTDGGILASALEYISGFKDFYTGEIEHNEDYGFPEYLGRGKWAVYGNAGPKKDVLNVLASIPSKYLVLDTTDENGHITRFYLDKSDKKQPKVLYFLGGNGGNDLVVALFKGGDLKKIEEMISKASSTLL
ncbi:MAG: leucine-rich repeat domain-containing protein [Muribaculaceae bacterium]|nr:leucine-rich repeat domain-containing protein [Muribaculaceae bacterium]